MTANPPAHCCTVGVRHEGEAKGSLSTFGDGIECYFAHPPKKTNKAIIVLTDIIGHKLINAQLIADQFAANGYLVAMPDLFFGDPVPLNRPEGFSLDKWRNGPPGHNPTTIDPIVEATIQELRAKHGIDRIGTVGYCFGGKYVIRFLAKGKGTDVGFTAHQSFVSEEEVRAIAGPISLAAAERDSIFTAENRRQTEGILAEIKVPYQINLYGDTDHGFAVRADIKDPKKKFAKEAAFEQAVTWFHEWL